MQRWLRQQQGGRPLPNVSGSVVGCAGVSVSQRKPALLFASGPFLRFCTFMSCRKQMRRCYSSTSWSTTYNPAAVEERWQNRWEEQRRKDNAQAATPSSSIDQSNKSYILSMFPYPSGNLHMGHVRVYTISDTIARYQRMRGKSVLHPMGWDAFGLPAENAAIERGIPPHRWTIDNINTMRQQMQRLGLSFDWDKEVLTCSPDYYKWTQWLFLQLHKAGMAYQKEALLNWDPIDQTVLANEQVDAEGRSWRSGAKVESKLMKQWFFRIGDFASSLVDDLELLRQGWPEQVIRMQENWIGRSEGSFLDFELVSPIPSSSLSTKEATKEDDEHKLRIFTTRMDTAFGATYVVVAPEHPLVKARIQQLLSSEGDEKNKQKGLELEKFVAEVMEARRAQRFEVGKSKNGMTLDIEVKHPFKKDIHLPIYVGDYVVMDYGTGAVMGVPAHDSRDWEFAHKHNLPIRPVISPSSDASSDSSSSLPFEGEGTLINSFKPEWNGLTSQQAKRQLTEWATRNGVGGTRVQYKLRDWLISRQRYWGAPIPIVYCENEGNGEGKGGCGAVPVPEEELPVVLPTGDEVKITGRGGSPLGQMEQWVHTRCPKCGGPAKRETDTMDTFVDSSWYFLRYPDAHNSKRVFDGAKTNQWMPVDVYIGGIEHAILHLLYSRFITKFLHSRGYIQHKEPFPNLLTQGMVTGQTFKDPHSGEFVKKEYVVQKGDKYFDTRTGTELKVSWEKMSKSKYNGIDPNQILSEYGADTARLFVLFKAPPPAELEWDPSAIAGQHRWLHRVWNLVNAALNDSNMEEKEGEQTEQNEKEVLRVVHETIKKVTQDLEAPSFSFNTAVAELMKLSNAIGTLSPRSPIYSLALRSLCLLMAPFAPHISSEMWSALSAPSYSSSSSSSSSLSFDEEATREWAGNISSSSVFSQQWPNWKEEYLQKDEVTVAIQVQGKTRGTIQVPRKWIERVENGVEDGEEERRKEEIERMARESEVGKRYLNPERGVEVVKVIVPSGRPLINFVVRENKKKKEQ